MDDYTTRTPGQSTPDTSSSPPDQPPDAALAALVAAIQAAPPSALEPETIARVAALDAAGFARISMYLSRVRGFPFREWKRAVFAARGQGEGRPRRAARPSVGARTVWPDAPADAPLPGDPWIYTPDGIYLPSGGTKDDALGLDWADSASADPPPTPILGPAYICGWAVQLEDPTQVRAELAVRIGRGWHRFYVTPDALLKADQTARLAARGLWVYGKPALAAAYLNAGYRAVRAAQAPRRFTAVAGLHQVDGQLVAVGPWGIRGPTGRATPDVVHDAEARLPWLQSVRFGGPDPGAATQVFRRVWAMADPNALAPAVGWFAATYWATMIRQVTGHFPACNLWASRGTGKTTLLRRLLLAFFGITSDEAIRSVSQTAFSALRDLAASNLVPVILDEYRLGEADPKRLAALHHLLRRAYDGSSESRGRPDQSVVTYALATPVVVAGETMIPDPALAERSVIVALAKADTVQHPGSQDAITWLRDHPSLAAGTAGWLLLRRLEARMQPPDMRQNLQTVRGIIAQAGGADLPDRVQDGLAAAGVGLGWLHALGLTDRAVADWPWARWVAAAREARKDRSTLDWFVVFLQIVFSNRGQFGGITVACAASADEVRVEAAPVEAAFDKFLKEHDLPRLGKETLRQELEQAGPHIFRCVGRRWVGGKTAHAYVLSPAGLERRWDIPAAFWAEALAGDREDGE
ncbi:MAG: hypothetical protein K6U87_04095 [Firmicutes bacterium]|nr:hypothetical protein [Bacillota bacterium]